ncbi:hypothetical protein GCM10008904_19750 [Paraclostridium ghonii]|uniref:Signal peptidase I n=1 Tax=Paraclostridium ghonii TaxID=29358 RepID=A0ABU0MX90_9FIRM|nr:signal peptidase I [Paeniclostridium ghonii]MDQ0555229.1 signal peptidase [Paeniclostridium ghonii]
MISKNILKVIANILFYSILVIAIVFTISMSKVKKSSEQVSLFGYKFYTVLTGSMKPTINPGSLVIVKQANAQDIKSGDIISFKSEHTSNITTHRVKKVVKEENIRFVTQGDANNVEDPMPIDSNLLLGKVVNFVPIIGATMIFVQSKPWILWIFIAVLLLMNFIPSGNKHNSNGKKALNQ